MGDLDCHGGQIGVFIDIDVADEERHVVAVVKVPVWGRLPSVLLIVLKERILDLKALKQVNPALSSHVWSGVRLLPVAERIILRHVGGTGLRVWMASQKSHADLPVEIAIVSSDLVAFRADDPTSLVLELGRRALLKVVPVAPERTTNSE